jgi:hypothetical protein
MLLSSADFVQGFCPEVLSIKPLDASGEWISVEAYFHSTSLATESRVLLLCGPPLFGLAAAITSPSCASPSTAIVSLREPQGNGFVMISASEATFTLSAAEIGYIRVSVGERVSFVGRSLALG